MTGAIDSGPLIVVIEDEPGIVDFIELGLREEGYRVESAGTGADGLQLVRRLSPDAVILDVGLPDVDGFDILAQIRSQLEVPVVMLTARGDVEDRVRGLELGADDYIGKPFHFAELLARVRVHLRRRRGRDDVLRVGDVELDPRARTVTRGGRSIALTTREHELLALLMTHAGEVLSKEVILDRLWGYAFDDNLVEVYIGYLRRKLGEPALVHTLRGAGYVLREPDSRTDAARAG